MSWLLMTTPTTNNALITYDHTNHQQCPDYVWPHQPPTMSWLLMTTPTTNNALITYDRTNH